MKNKGVSPIIATVLLITLTIIAGTILLNFGSDYLKQLSPPPDCSGVNFDAGIYRESNGNLNLEISNTGNAKIEAITIQIKDENENIELKEIPISVESSESKKQTIEFTISENSEIRIIPQVKNTQDKLVQCPDFSKLILLVNIGN